MGSRDKRKHMASTLATTSTHVHPPTMRPCMHVCMYAFWIQKKPSDCFNNVCNRVSYLIHSLFWTAVSPQTEGQTSLYGWQRFHSIMNWPSFPTISAFSAYFENLVIVKPSDICSRVEGQRKFKFMHSFFLISSTGKATPPDKRERHQFWQYLRMPDSQETRHGGMGDGICPSILCEWEDQHRSKLTHPGWVALSWNPDAWIWAPASGFFAYNVRSTFQFLIFFFFANWRFQMSLRQELRCLVPSVVESCGLYAPIHACLPVDRVRLQLFTIWISTNLFTHINRSYCFSNQLWNECYKHTAHRNHIGKL